MIDDKEPDYQISLTDFEQVIRPGGQSGFELTGGISGVDEESIEKGKAELIAANEFLNNLGLAGELTFSEPTDGKKIFGGNPLKPGKYDDEEVGLPWSVNLGIPPSDPQAN